MPAPPSSFEMEYEARHLAVQWFGLPVFGVEG